MNCLKWDRCFVGLLSDSLRQILLDKVRKMQRIQKNPYNKSTMELQEIDKVTHSPFTFYTYPLAVEFLFYTL